MLLDKSVEITVCGVIKDCSVSGEEAAACEGDDLRREQVGLDKGRACRRMQARSKPSMYAAVNKLGAVPVDAPRHRQTRVIW